MKMRIMLTKMRIKSTKMVMLTKMGMLTNLPLSQMPSPTLNLRSVGLEDVEDVEGDDEDETITPEKDHKCNF